MTRVHIVQADDWKDGVTTLLVLGTDPVSAVTMLAPTDEDGSPRPARRVVPRLPRSHE